MSNKENIITALRQFAESYNWLCELWNENPDLMEDAFQDALSSNGYEGYPFFNGSFDELEISSWAYDMMDIIKNDYMEESLHESSDDGMSYEEVERILTKLTNNGSKSDGTVSTGYESEKNNAKKVLQKLYKVVEVSDGRMSKGEPMSWVISYGSPLKSKKESYSRRRKRYRK